MRPWIPLRLWTQNSIQTLPATTCVVLTLQWGVPRVARRVAPLLAAPKMTPESHGASSAPVRFIACHVCNVSVCSTAKVGQILPRRHVLRQAIAVKAHSAGTIAVWTPTTPPPARALLVNLLTRVGCGAAAKEGFIPTEILDVTSSRYCLIHLDWSKVVRRRKTHGIGQERNRLTVPLVPV